MSMQPLINLEIPKLPASIRSPRKKLTRAKMLPRMNAHTPPVEAALPVIERQKKKNSGIQRRQKRLIQQDTPPYGENSSRQKRQKPEYDLHKTIFNVNYLYENSISR